MRKSYIGGLIILCIIVIFTPTVGAYQINAFIHPTTGTVETKILLTVRADPGHKGPMYLYVFCDDICVVQRKVPFKLTSTIHSWDVTFSPIKDVPRSSKGYLIKVQIDDNGVLTESYVNYFGITDYIPPAELWENLPQGFIDEITGPPGPRGYQGIQGRPGSEGPEGPEGPIGETGSQGLQGEMGPQGLTGEIGPLGEGIDGSDGEDAPVELLYVSLVLSGFALLWSFVTWKRR